MATAARRALDDYLALPYRISLQRGSGTENGEWVAQVEELPGCLARAETPEKAARGARAAMRAWLQEALDEGREIPEPRAAGHSGRLLLRMPQTLHAELARRADQEGVSLNQFLVGTLAGAMGWLREDGNPANGGDRAGGDPIPAPAPAAPPRLASVALVVNLIVVVVAAAVAIALLIAAWQSGW